MRYNHRNFWPKKYSRPTRTVWIHKYSFIFTASLTVAPILSWVQFFLGNRIFLKRSLLGADSRHIARIFLLDKTLIGCVCQLNAASYKIQYLIKAQMRDSTALNLASFVIVPWFWQYDTLQDSFNAMLKNTEHDIEPAARENFW